MRGKLIWTLALGLNIAGVGHAATDAEAAAQDSAAENGTWQFAVTPYLWTAGISGDIQLADGEPVDIDKSFADLLGALKFAAMMAAEARHDRFVMLGDIFYLSLGTDAHGPAGFVDADVDMEIFAGTLVAGYRVVDRGPLFLDLFAGGRFTSLAVGIDLSGPTQTVQRDNSKSSIAPVVGARFRTPLGGRWGLAVYGDLAGFGAASHQTWQLMTTIQYDLSDRWRLAAGYRHVSVDIDKPDFHVDLAVSGPIFGFSYRF